MGTSVCRLELGYATSESERQFTQAFQIGPLPTLSEFEASLFQQAYFPSSSRAACARQGPSFTYSRNWDYRDDVGSLPSGAYGNDGPWIEQALEGGYGFLPGYTDVVWVLTNHKTVWSYEESYF